MSERRRSPLLQICLLKKKTLIRFAARLGASVPMMVSIINCRFTQDSRACLAAALLSRHVTSDLVNAVEAHSFVGCHQIHFDVFVHKRLAYGTVR